MQALFGLSSVVFRLITFRHGRVTKGKLVGSSTVSAGLAWPGLAVYYLPRLLSRVFFYCLIISCCKHCVLQAAPRHLNNSEVDYRRRGRER